MAGASEPEFRAMVKAYGWGWHKYGDVRYCIYCHKALPKSELMPDFMVNLQPIFVEVKNNNATGRWDFANDIGPEGARKAQRQFLIENDGWLFIELGQGRRPKNFGAFLIPMRQWLTLEEPLGQSSLPLHGTARLVGADVALDAWALKWEDGHWTIPKGHIWWYHLKSITESLLKSIEERL